MYSAKTSLLHGEEVCFSKALIHQRFNGAYKKYALVTYPGVLPCFRFVSKEKRIRFNIHLHNPKLITGCHDQFWASRRDTLTNHVSSEHEDIYEKDVQVVKHLLRRSSIPFVFAHDKTLYTNKLPLSHNMPSSTNPAKTPPTSLGGLRDAIEIKRKATGQRLQGPSYIHSIASSSNSGMTRIQSTLRPLSSSGQDTRETTRTSRNTKASQIQNIVESDDDDSDDESQCGYMFSDLSKNSKTSDSVEDGTFDETLLLAFRRVRLGEDNLNRISRPVDVGQRVRENVWLRAKQDNIGWSAFTRRHIHMLGQGTDIDIDTYIKQGS